MISKPNLQPSHYPCITEHDFYRSKSASQVFSDNSFAIKCISHSSGWTCSGLLIHPGNTSTVLFLRPDGPRRRWGYSTPCYLQKKQPQTENQELVQHVQLIVIFFAFKADLILNRLSCSHSWSQRRSRYQKQRSKLHFVLNAQPQKMLRSMKTTSLVAPAVPRSF